jgi:hypothetical protein
MIPVSARILRQKALMKIIFNGREYASVDEMPSDEREEYETVMKSLGRNLPGANPTGKKSFGVTINVHESITVNGKTYKSRNELPPEIRAALEATERQGSIEKQTDAEIRTDISKTIPGPAQIHFGTSEDRPSYPWRIILFLVIVILALLGLWLSGLKRH